MATLAGLIDRARLEIGDSPRPFTCQSVGNDVTTLIEAPIKPIDSQTVVITTDRVGYTPTYVVDERNGLITFSSPVPDGTAVSIAGVAFRYFTNAEWSTFVETALLQHLHNRAGVTLANLDPVEEYPVSLLAVTEALYALINDAAFDIDISTPEGVGIPRHQRYEQLMEMLVARLDQYNKLSSALNVGLNRIEMFDLKRKSLTTGKFVQTYITQELEDTRFPVRAFTPIDTDGTKPSPDSVPDVSLTITQGEPYQVDLNLQRNLTGVDARVTLRKYRGSAGFKYFDVKVVDSVAGKISASMLPGVTYTLGGGPYWWDVRLIQNGYATTLVEGPVIIEERARV